MTAIRHDFISSLVDPHLTYQFQILISPVRGEDGADAGLLSVRVAAASIPGSSIEKAVVDLGGGHRVNYAGLRRFAGSWPFTLVEGQDLAVMRRFASWMKLCHNQRNGVQAFAADYRSNVYVLLQNNPREDVGQRVLFNAWPESQGDVALNFSATDIHRQEITMSYDIWDDEE